MTEIYSRCILNLDNRLPLIPTEISHLTKVLTSDDLEIVFTASCIMSNGDFLYVEGDVGYCHDLKEISLALDKTNNIIYILSGYRLLYEPDDYLMFNDTFTYTVGSKPVWNNERLNFMDTNDVSIITKSVDSTPYYRFPRTKDGISILRVIYNIFKVFHTDGPKPSIVIPSEYYY